MKESILVIGGSSFLGQHVLRHQQEHFSIVPTGFSHSVGTSHSSVKLDITDGLAVLKVLKEVRPQTILLLAASTNPNFCELNPQESKAINLDAVANLAECANGVGAKLVFTSTDLVFDGNKGHYSEDDLPSPINIYGKHKLEAERTVLDANQRNVVCRMPLMFGAAFGDNVSVLQGMMHSLKNDKPLKLFTDEFRTPVDGVDAAKGLFWAARRVEGLVHLGGKTRISRFDFGSLLCKMANLPEQLLEPCKQADVNMPAKRSPDVSLNSNFAHSTGYRPASLEEQIERSL